MTHHTNAYNYYFKIKQEHIRKNNPEMSQKDVMKLIGDQWSHLDEEEKEYWRKRSDDVQSGKKSEAEAERQASKAAG